MDRLRRIVLLSSLIALHGCASRPMWPELSRGDQQDEPTVSGGQLDDMLARQAGIRVEGQGSQARVHVSGADYPNPPLFVIDGLAIGNDFRAIWSMVQPTDVAAVKVIRANETAAAVWGARGGNGVIEITTRRGGD